MHGGVAHAPSRPSWERPGKDAMHTVAGPSVARAPHLVRWQSYVRSRSHGFSGMLGAVGSKGRGILPHRGRYVP
jgi:hypothetical protein